MSIIYAFATPNIASAIGVVRFSGSGIENLFKEILSLQNIKEKELTYIKIIYKKNEIDSGMYYFRKAPNTVTGEEYGELHLHGSLAVFKKIKMILSEFENVRPAQKGEFTKISFLNGKQDLTQAESVHDLITAKTDFERDISLQYMNGKISDEVRHYVEMIYQILSVTEAQLDFSEDEIDIQTENSLRLQLNDLIKKISDRAARKETLENIHSGGLKIAVIGSPNAGKSSFINHLTGKNYAIVTEIAGTTRDSIEIPLEIEGFPVILYDTAGLRRTSCMIEAEGIRRALEISFHADLVFYLEDVHIFLQQKQSPILPTRFIKIISKIDLIQNEDELALLNNKHLTFSIRQENTHNLIFNFIKGFFINKFNQGDGHVLLKKRYQEIYQKALAHLFLAKKFLTGKNYPLFSQALRGAISEIETISGKFSNDETLDRIFSNFCIGK